MKPWKIILSFFLVVSVLLIAGFIGFKYSSGSTTNAVSADISSEYFVDIPDLSPVFPPVAENTTTSMKAYVQELVFLESLKGILGNQTSNYGIYIKDLSSHREYTINADMVLAPASVSKVPYGILALKRIDEGVLTYDTRLTLQSYHKSYTTDPLYSFSAGSTWSVRDLLRLLLVDSDNVAMAMLEEYFGGSESFNQQVAQIGVPGLTRNPHQTTPRAVGDIFEKIYTGELLSEESNQVLIDYLSTYKLFTSDRIRLGVVRAGGDGNQVVHKIGNLPGVYHDAGYVRSPGGDFVIVVLNQNRTPGQGVAEITAITQEVYKFFNE